MMTYVLAFMFFYFPPRDLRQGREEQQIAKAIVVASLDENDALWLASVASFEGSYRIGARGKLGEIGPWQLMPPPRARAVPRDLVGQAREALARWRLLGPCGYTGEPTAWGLKKARRPGAGPEDDLEGLAKNCPLAFHRLMRAKAWRAAHPFNPFTASLP